MLRRCHPMVLAIRHGIAWRCASLRRRVPTDKRSRIVDPRRWLATQAGDHAPWERLPRSRTNRADANVALRNISVLSVEALGGLQVVCVVRSNSLALIHARPAVLQSSDESKRPSCTTADLDPVRQPNPHLMLVVVNVVARAAAMTHTLGSERSCAWSAGAKKMPSDAEGLRRGRARCEAQLWSAISCP